ncbi:ABC transporter permease [Granulimonas faecalis]|uniref:ABC transporter permease n=1 Tax=Granulimonas faecalis TaxID=2894155 RepID=UPI0035116F8B
MASNSRGLRMGSQVALEFSKLRHRHLVAVCIAMVAFVLLWFGSQGAKQVVRSDDYRTVLYSLPQINAVILPLLSTVVASTVCDIENRTNKWKELLTIERADSLFCAKWLTCAILLAATVTGEVAATTALGVVLGFDPVPLGEAAVLWASTLGVCLFVSTVVEAICFFANNQFLPVATGIVLSFLGLFSLYLPPAVSVFVPSAYFGLLSTVSMTYDAASGSIIWGSVPWPLWRFLLVAVITAAAFLLSLRVSSRKEL